MCWGRMIWVEALYGLLLLVVNATKVVMGVKGDDDRSLVKIVVN